jgi:hypothetical protein
MPYRYGSKSSRNLCKHWLGTLSRLKRPLVAGDRLPVSETLTMLTMLTQMLTHRLFQNPNVYAGCCTVAPGNAPGRGREVKG